MDSSRDTERIQAAYIARNCSTSSNRHKEHVDEFVKIQRAVKQIFGRYPYNDATDPGVSFAIDCRSEPCFMQAITNSI
jgi:hypothetical protein